MSALFSLPSPIFEYIMKLNVLRKEHLDWQLLDSAFKWRDQHIVQLELRTE